MEKKNVVVTGCSRGIGKEIVNNLLVNDLVETVIGTSQDLGNLSLISDPKFKKIALNYNDLKSIEDAVKNISELGLPIDCLINNSGKLINKSFKSTSMSDLNELFMINVMGPYLFMQGMLGSFRKGTHSHIVNIGSMGGVQGSSKFPGLSAYSSSKGALSVLTECLAEELKAEGINVNCLCLGSVNTDMLREAFPGYRTDIDPKQMAKFICDFTIENRNLFNGKNISIANTTP